MLVVESYASVFDRVFQEEQCHFRQEGLAQSIGEDEEEQEEEFLNRTAGEESDDALDIACPDGFHVIHDVTFLPEVFFFFYFGQHKVIACK